MQDPNAWADSVIAQMDAMQGPLPGTPEADAQTRANIGKVLEQRKAEDPAWLDSAMAEMDEYAKDPTAAENAIDALKGGARGVIGAAKQVLLDAPKTLGGAMGLTYDNPVAQGYEGVFTSAQDALQPPSLRRQDSAYSQYGEMTGYVAPTLAAMLGGAGLVATVGGAQQAGASGEMARQAGAGQGGIALAGLGGAILGSVGGAAAEGVLTRINTMAGNAVIRAIERDAATLPLTARMAITGATKTGIRAAEATGAGAGMGLAYTALTNAIHNYAADDDIPLLLGAHENAALGAALGGFIRGATEAAIQKRRFTGRKFTANGWEGPELDMSGMMEPHPEFNAPEPSAFAGIDSWLHDKSISPEIRRDTAESMGAEEAASQAQNPPPIEYTGDAARLPVLDENGAQAKDKQGRLLWRDPPTRRPVSSISEPEYVPYDSPEYGISENDGRTRVEDPRTGKLVEPPSRTSSGKPQPEYVPIDDPNRGISAPDEGYTSKGNPESKQPKPKPFEGPTRDVEGGIVKDRFYTDPNSPMEGSYAIDDKGRRIPSLPAKSTPPTRVNEQGFVVETPYEAQPSATRYMAANAPTITSADLQPVKDAQGRTVVNIGGRLRGTLEDTANSPRIVTRQEPIDGMLEAALVLNPKAALREGGMPDEASALFSPVTNVARIKYGDISGAVHELAHAIEDRIVQSEDSPFLTEKSEDIKSELTRLGKIANPGKEIPTNGYLSEGWAEYVRMWTLQHEDLMRFAPETTRWFETSILKKKYPDFGAKLDQARNSADIYRYQGDIKRVQSTIADPPTKARRNLQSIIRELHPNNLLKQFVSSHDALRRYENAKKALGKATPQNRRLDNMMEVLTGMADQTVSHFVNTATIGFHGNKTGESLTAAVESMVGKQAELETYMKARRAEWLLTERTGVDPATGETIAAPHDIGIALQGARGAIAKFETKYPHIADTAARVQAWHERVLDYVVECDPDFAAAREAMRQDGEYYIPGHKWFDDVAAMGRRGDKSAARGLKLGEKLSDGGSARPTKPIITQYQTDAASLFRRAHERMMLKSLIVDGRDAGIGGLFEKITDTLHGKGDGFTFGQDVPDGLEAEANLDAFFSKPTMDQSNRAVFKFVELETDPITGVQRRVVNAYAVHPDVYDALIGMNPADLKMGLGHVGTIGRMFRNAQISGHIVLSPAWALYKNAAYDPTTAFINTRYSHAFRDLVLDWIPTMVRTAAHEFTSGKVPGLRSEWVDVYRGMRSNVSAKFESENVAQSRGREIMQTPGKRVKSVLTSWDDMYEIAGRLMGISDEAPRIWELKRAAREVGWKPGQEMTREQFTEMSLASKRITGNRSIGGEAVNKINLFVPFFRAAFVQPRDTIRAATAEGNRLRFAIKAASIGALGAVYWAMTHNDEGIDSQDAQERFNYITLPMTDGPPVHIPLAPEAAMFFKSVEFALDAMYDSDPLKASEIGEAIAKTYAPPVLAAAIEEPILQFSNRRSFNGQAQIDKPGILPEEQFDEYTGKLAVMIGQTFSMSPRRVEHAVKGIFGAPGEWAMDAFPMKPDQKNDQTYMQAVLEGNWLRRGGNISSRSRWVDQLSSLTAMAEMKARSRFTPETQEQRMLRAQLSDAMRASITAYALAKTYAITDAGKQGYYKFANEIAKQAVKDANAGTINPGPAKAARLQLEAQAKAAAAESKAQRQ